MIYLCVLCGSGFHNTEIEIGGITRDSEPIKAGVIGVGYLGKHHARVYNEISGVQLFGVSDINCNLG
ncbi:MAG: hypothetical protein U9R01_04675, partial [candidate division WOR-3 bacterium]|nr:hypothetical protein [candidate division WOR-3 bacterium]